MIDIIGTYIMFSAGILLFSSFVAMASFEYYAIKNNVEDHKIQVLLNNLKFPLNKLYNTSKSSMFYFIHEQEIIDYVRTKPLQEALSTRRLFSGLCLVFIIIAIGQLFYMDSLIDQIITAVFAFSMSIVLLNAWRFGSKLT